MTTFQVNGSPKFVKVTRVKGKTKMSSPIAKDKLKLGFCDFMFPSATVSIFFFEEKP